MQVRAWEWGLGVAFLVALVVWVMPLGRNDFSAVFWPVGRAADPYACGRYAYPVWNTWMLRGLALFPAPMGLSFLWACSIVYVVSMAPLWDTPAWVALLAPPFLAAMLYGQPFEAMVLVGVSLIAAGWRDRQAWLMGMGMALCLFKVQVGLVPALIGAYHLAFRVRGKRWMGLAIPVGMVGLATLLEGAFYGRLWVGPWLQAMGQAQEVAMAWNVARLLRFSALWFLWLPIGGWALCHVRDFQRRLWVAMALGLLVSPYWVGYSMYPLVAMVGCWREFEGRGK